VLDFKRKTECAALSVRGWHPNTATVNAKGSGDMVALGDGDMSQLVNGGLVLLLVDPLITAPSQALCV
jgi:hypothetical protein